MTTRERTSDIIKCEVCERFFSPASRDEVICPVCEDKGSGTVRFFRR